MWRNWNTAGFFGWSMMIVFWVTIVTLMAWASQTARDPQTGSTALETLKDRYAAEEIDDEEFEERRRLFGKSARGGS